MGVWWRLIELGNVMSTGFNVKFYEAIDAMRFIKENLRTEYNKEPEESFAISYVQLQQIVNLLYIAIDEGQSQSQFKKALKLNGIELPKYAPEAFYRTINQACYMAGKWEKFQRNKDSRPYLMYDAINDSRVRPAHLAMDGIIRPVGDSFWNAHLPPNGINCRCSIISLTESQAQQRSGSGMGLNKAINDNEMQPDEKWNFNAGKDLLAFIRVGVIGLAKIGAEYNNC